MQDTRSPFAFIFEQANAIRGARITKPRESDARLEGLTEGMESDSRRGAVARLGAEPSTNIFGQKR